MRKAGLLLVLLVALMGALDSREAQAQGERETVASCYGEELRGSLQANGLPFDPHAMSVAHRSLPFGTRVGFRVGNTFVVAIVTDRGPFVQGREFDLSCGAMRALGLPPGVYLVMVS